MNTTCATDNSESDMSAPRQEGEGDKLEGEADLWDRQPA